MSNPPLTRVGISSRRAYFVGSNIKNPPLRVWVFIVSRGNLTDTPRKTMNDGVPLTNLIATARVYNVRVTETLYSDIVIISEPISTQRLVNIVAAGDFGDMVKAVVDIERRLLALGGCLQSDEEAALIQQGSTQADLWGINIYPEKPRLEWVEFDSMINVRPRFGNRSRGVEDAGMRKLIEEIVDSLIQ